MSLGESYTSTSFFFLFGKNGVVAIPGGLEGIWIDLFPNWGFFEFSWYDESDVSEEELELDEEIPSWSRSTGGPKNGVDFLGLSESSMRWIFEGLSESSIKIEFCIK